MISETNVKLKYSLDDILRVIGRFGRYQICVFLLICLGTGYANIFTLNFVFTAGEIKHRCRISECESSNAGDYEYQPNWLESAVPFENDLPKSCIRYAFQNNTGNECTSSGNFDRSIENECSKWIYDDYENTIVKEVCYNKLNIHQFIIYN